MSISIDDIVESITTFAQSLQDDNRQFRDRRGNVIINHTPESRWFSENVSFMFSKGVIFDEYDKEMM